MSSDVAVADSIEGGVVSLIVISRSGAASIPFSNRSETASASMSSCGVVSAAKEACWDGVSVNVTVSPETAWAAPVSANPPVELPDSRTCRLPRLTVAPRLSLNVTASSPSPVVYPAEEKVGGVVSLIVISRSGAASIPFSDRSETASASMSSCGVVSAAKEACWDGVSVNVTVSPETAWAAPVSANPPVELPDSRTCRLPRLTVAPRLSLNVTASSPSPVVYPAEEKVGGAVSSIVMARSGAASIPFSDRSETASASMSSCGVVSAAKEACWDGVSVNVTVSPETAWAAPVSVMARSGAASTRLSSCQTPGRAGCPG